MALLNSISSSLSGMKVAQAQLEIVSNNIANVDTEGYTRKTASQSALVAAASRLSMASVLSPMLRFTHPSSSLESIRWLSSPWRS